ncbi:MAG: alpha-amylase [Bacteroidales bacterium]|nr:alpha-amylase [Bacteroidales bacterium]
MRQYRIGPHPRLLIIMGCFLGSVTMCILSGCVRQKTDNAAGGITLQSEVRHPAWSVQSVIYEVNIRQYTPGGTFNDFLPYLERLRDLGTDILWLMPIHPIGEKNRKGSLGSYYSIRDYRAVNPEFGTLDDFKKLVNEAHQLGLKVIIDWVANHSAWDNPLIELHPEWYTRDSAGMMVSPFDWTDVADLDYEQAGLWDWMIESMKFWVVETGIDGFRCDVAGMVPTAFWEKARTSLEKVKPVFMLAEAEQPDHHIRAFDMSYNWELHHLFNEIAAGSSDPDAITACLEKQGEIYPADAYRMLFTSNHDENSWKGSAIERLGFAAAPMAVLSFTLPGMPLIYSGQEAGIDRKLLFFDKDTIDWDLDTSWFGFYHKLARMKRGHPSLANGSSGGRFVPLSTTAGKRTFAFARELNGPDLIVLTHFSEQPARFLIKEQGISGSYTDLFSGRKLRLKTGDTLALGPWGYQILTRD